MHMHACVLRVVGRNFSDREEIAVRKMLLAIYFYDFLCGSLASRLTTPLSCATSFPLGEHICSIHLVNILIN